METMETHANPAMNCLAARSSTETPLFLLVRTTSDATLDAGSGKASIGLTQEQPEERIGSAKDPQRFCLTILSSVLCVLEFKVEDMSLSVVKICVFNGSITEVHITVLPPGVSCKIGVKIYLEFIQMVPAS